MDRNIGKKLDGRYEITELIGIGGMADVYKAIDIIDDRVVAVKILKTEFSNDDEFLRRFRNESKAIAVLSHPNIVKIYDVGFTEKIQFIVMEYIDGITLKEFMEQQGILKWKDAIHFIIQILRALQHAHDRGIVHRDIKPQNIMLFPDGTIKVMDFGIARFAREEGKTLSDKAIGSVHYISPEQARGDITDEKSDIYSVGVMLYEMLTGQKPFDADNPVSVALMHMQSKAKNPREINETIPEGLEDIVIRAMQKDASKRYQSASEMIKDIEEFKRNPSIVFEYKYLTPPVDENTRYFEPVSSSKNESANSDADRNKIKSKVPKMFKQKAKPKPEYDDYDDDDYDDYDDDDYDDDDDDYDDRRRSGGRSLIVPVLGAVTAAVVIIAAFFITNMIIKIISPYGVETYTMPNLVGMTITDAQSQYPYFRIVELSEEYSEYPTG
ncbi:MAG: Stk1 family PASTA domain-containing Ser/Thr kinase, partial [Oscillospiraceae bacterium]